MGGNHPLRHKPVKKRVGQPLPRRIEFGWRSGYGFAGRTQFQAKVTVGLKIKPVMGMGELSQLRTQHKGEQQQDETNTARPDDSARQWQPPQGSGLSSGHGLLLSLRHRMGSQTPPQRFAAGRHGQ
jgi:hypothetical protein